MEKSSKSNGTPKKNAVSEKRNTNSVEIATQTPSELEASQEFDNDEDEEMMFDTKVAEVGMNEWDILIDFILEFNEQHR